MSIHFDISTEPTSGDRDIHFHIPSWVKKGLLGAALLFAATGGAVVHTIPKSELSYSSSAQFVTCTKHGCYASYEAVIGNTGRTLQHEVTVSVDRRLKEQEHSRLDVSNFGVILRPYEESDEDDATTTIHLGTLEPGKRVHVRLFSSVDGDRTDAPNADEVFSRIESAEGAGVQGHPANVSFARVIYGLLQI